MRNVSIVILGVILLAGCNSDDATNEVIEDETVVERNPKEVVKEAGIEVEVYDFENFKPLLHQNDNKVHVVNFWATWCVPCVAELPFFEELGEKYPEVDVLLVSLDFPKMVSESLIPFIKKNELKSEVILLDEPDANSWIPQVDPKWSGAIPATIIYKNNKSKFYEQSFNFAELEAAVASIDK